MYSNEIPEFLKGTSGEREIIEIERLIDFIYSEYSLNTTLVVKEEKEKIFTF